MRNRYISIQIEPLACLTEEKSLIERMKKDNLKRLSLPDELVQVLLSKMASGDASDQVKVYELL